MQHNIEISVETKELAVELLLKGYSFQKILRVIEEKKGLKLHEDSIAELLIECNQKRIV